jgi:hypothetical protein
VRRAQAQQSTEHENKLREVLSQVSELSRARADLTKQIKAFTSTAEQLQNDAEQPEQILKQRDEPLEQERKQLPDAHLLKRRLEAEQERRIAAERRIEELLHHPSAGNAAGPTAPASSSMPPSAAGLYVRHATAAGYDVTRDPLFELMRQDVLIADRYAAWQATRMDRVTSRRRDSNQTLDEQAYAAAMAARWRLVDHPHLRLGAIPTWSLLGCLIDKRSGRYLLTITQERIDEMQSRMGR